jgi:hypothetical protein
MRRAVPWAPLLPLAKDLGDELDLAAGGDARQHLEWEAGHSIAACDAVNLALEVASRPVASASSQAGLRITSA